MLNFNQKVSFLIFHLLEFSPLPLCQGSLQIILIDDFGMPFAIFARS